VCTGSGKGKLKTQFFLLQCAVLPGDLSIKPGAQRFQGETLRLRVKPGDLATLGGDGKGGKQKGSKDKGWEK